MYTKEETIITATETRRTTFKKLNHWRGNVFESSTGRTEEFSAFVRMYKAHVKKQAEANGLDLVSWNNGHFYCSGFAKNKTTGKFVYFFCSDVRYFVDAWADDIFVRSAQHEKDYTGGTNESATIENIGQRMAEITR